MNCLAFFVGNEGCVELAGYGCLGGVRIGFVGGGLGLVVVEVDFGIEVGLCR
jgi:hypothetical protein